MMMRAGPNWNCGRPAGLWLIVRGLLALTVLSVEGRADAIEVDCAGCHVKQGDEFKSSIHAAAFSCQQCHGGPKFYELTSAAREQYAAAVSPVASRPVFDHGQG